MHFVGPICDHSDMAKREFRSIASLAQEVGIPPRTLRSWVEKKLIPAPAHRGRGACYGEGHLDRARFLVRLRRAGHSLDQASAWLQDLPHDQIARMASGSESFPDSAQPGVSGPSVVGLEAAAASLQMALGNAGGRAGSAEWWVTVPVVDGFEIRARVSQGAQQAALEEIGDLLAHLLRPPL